MGLFESKEFASELFDGPEVATEAPMVAEQEPGRYCQFTRIGNGFAPVGPTTRRMPSGVYTIKIEPGSIYFKPKKILTDNLLQLPDLKSTEIMQEIEKFWTLKDKFRKFGFNYKRGALLYGKPGTGKTTTLNMVMKRTVEMGGVVIMGHINFGAVPMMLQAFREVHPERALVVIFEDVDEIASNDETKLLALLDGEDNIDNVFFLATTNYLNAMDHRLTNRPSRFDKVVEILPPNAESRMMYLESRNLGLTPVQLQYWAEISEGFCIAQLKELIVSVLCLENPLESTVERLRNMTAALNRADAPVKYKKARLAIPLMSKG